MEATDEGKPLQVKVLATQLENPPTATLVVKSSEKTCFQPGKSPTGMLCPEGFVEELLTLPKRNALPPEAVASVNWAALPLILPFSISLLAVEVAAELCDSIYTPMPVTDPITRTTLNKESIERLCMRLACCLLIKLKYSKQFSLWPLLPVTDRQFRTIIDQRLETYG